MDTGEGLPTSWAMRTTDDCIQVEDYTGFLVDIVEFITMLFFDMLMCAYITALMSEQPGLLSWLSSEKCKPLMNIWRALGFCIFECYYNFLPLEEQALLRRES